MNKPFQIWQYLYGQDACNLHRMLLPARYCHDTLLKEGIKVSCNDGIPNDERDFDAVVWHGVPTSFENRIIGKGTEWQMHGKTVVWSVDDDYRCIPSWNPVKMNSSMTTTAVWAARSCNHVLASTQTLAETFAGREVITAPNLLELPLYKPWETGRETIRVMFAGSCTHVGDLEQLVLAVDTVLDKYPTVEFVFMGCAHPEIKRKHLYNGVMEWPLSPMKDYWNIICSLAPDIWVCPLVDCDFNQSKSCLKVIEGMALEAAVVASDVQPYREVVVSGENGILVNPEDGGVEWSDALCLLVENAALRKRIAQAGRDTVEERHNWHREACTRPWMDYYRKVAGVA